MWSLNSNGSNSQSTVRVATVAATAFVTAEALVTITAASGNSVITVAAA